MIGERYRIDRFLDEGGAGEVYAAQNAWTSRQVAVKRLLPELQTESTLVERFVLEGRIGGRVEHPNIVQVLDMGRETSDGSLFIVQELLRGAPLRAVIERSGRLSVGDALDLVVPILGALVAVHQEGIVHRDIKPENIFVQDGSFGHRIPKLLDFGIAKASLESTLTKAGSVMGTLGYMPPEQLAGAKDVDRRADIWSVGIVLYELVAGAHPFAADSYVEALDKIMRRDARPLHDIVPDCPKGFSDIVGRTLRKNRQDRPDSMLTVLEDLLRWSHNEPDGHLHSLFSRHRLSVPASIEQKLRAPAGSVMPPPLWSSLSSVRRAQGSPTVTPSQLAWEPRADANQDIEVDVDMSSEAPPSATDSSADDTLFDLREAMLPGEAARGRARGATDVPPVETSVSAPPETTRCAADDDLAPESEPSIITIDAYIALAAQALTRNDFVIAMRVADMVVAAALGDPETQADMRLLQARACFWRGDAAMHEAHAFDAYHLAVPGSRLRMQASAELACASSDLGAHARLHDLVDDLTLARVQDDVLPDYLVACCRVGIALQRAGWPEHVERVLGRIQTDLDRQSDCPDVRAWTLLMRAELAAHTGDHAHSLTLTNDAVRAFEEQGDTRWACVCKGNVGRSMLLLGGYEEACELLSRAIAEATASNLSQATIMRLNLGIATVRRGEINLGIEQLRPCVATLEQSPDSRSACIGHIYLAEALALCGSVHDAEREARMAVDAAQLSPTLRAQALATLAQVVMDRPMEAFMAASQAMDILASVGGVTEDDARIRLAYALALQALGHIAKAKAALVDARNRLVERAERISDERWRSSFLKRVRDHARTFELASDVPATEPLPVAGGG